MGERSERGDEGGLGLGGENKREPASALRLAPLRLFEDRTMRELMMSGDAAGARVIVLASGELGTADCRIVRDGTNKIVGVTRLEVSVDGHKAMPYSPEEVAPITRAALIAHQIGGDTSVDQLRTRTNGYVWREDGEWSFVAEGASVGTKIPVSLNVLEPIETSIKPGALVSSIRVVRRGAHSHVAVWNRGALAGALIVRAEDEQGMVELLGNGMCSGRANAIARFRELEADLLEAIRKLEAIDKDMVCPACPDGIKDIITSLGDSAIVADRAARAVESEIPR